MSKHVGIIRDRLYPQPEYTIAVDREGKWTATQVFLCHRESITKMLPPPGTPHPEISFLNVDNSSVKVTEGDLAVITCNYAGTDSKGPDENKTSYSLGLSLSEEPILAHKKFKDISDEEKEALQAIIAGKDKDGSTTYKSKVKSTLGKKALEKIMRGQTTFYSPKVVWKESTVVKVSNAAVSLSKLGLIDTPSGRAPSLSHGRTWLFNGATQSHEGSTYRIEREWLASDTGGWDSDIYTS